MAARRPRKTYSGPATRADHSAAVTQHSGAPPPRATPALDRQTELFELIAAHRGCVRCVVAGHLARARPVFSGRPGQRVLLVGQAPGPVEADVERPFAGRAGRQLMRWLQRAGFADEADVRARVWITSVTTCFPGRRHDGSGDRRPSSAEVALCAPWLDRTLALLAPPLVVTVGGMALERVAGRRRRLDDCVGEVLDEGGRLVVALPHPSGQSRWLNDRDRAALLERALARLAELVAWAERAQTDR